MIPPEVQAELDHLSSVVAVTRGWGRMNNALFRKTLSKNWLVRFLMADPLAGMPGSKTWTWLETLGQDTSSIKRGMVGYQELVIPLFELVRGDDEKEAVDKSKSELPGMVAELHDKVTRAVGGALRKAAPAPEVVNYKGFRIENPEGLSERFLVPVLGAVDYILAMFKKRGVEAVLRTGLKGVVIRHRASGEGNVAGLYNSINKKIYVLARPGEADPYSGFGRHLEKWVNEVFIHEFGHHVHMSYIHPEARAMWDSGWEMVDKAKKALEDLGKVTRNDRVRFWALIEKSGWDPMKAGKKLKGIERAKYLVWLDKTPNNKIIQNSKTVRLTPYGKSFFEFRKNPQAWASERYPADLGYTDKERAEMIEDRLIKQEEAMGIHDTYEYPKLEADYLEQLRKEDKTVDAALDSLGIPSDYGRTNVLEDFAETFVVWLTNPHKLSETAKYRMDRSLWLSGFYGKPAARMAAKVAKMFLGRNRT